MPFAKGNVDQSHGLMYHFIYRFYREENVNA